MIGGDVNWDRLREAYASSSEPLSVLARGWRVPLHEAQSRADAERWEEIRAAARARTLLKEESELDDARRTAVAALTALLLACHHASGDVRSLADTALRARKACGALWMAAENLNHTRRRP